MGPEDCIYPHDGNILCRICIPAPGKWGIDPMDDQPGGLTRTVPGIVMTRKAALRTRFAYSYSISCEAGVTGL